MRYAGEQLLVESCEFRGVQEVVELFGKYGAIRSVKLRFEPVTGFALTARLENCAFGLFP